MGSSRRSSGSSSSISWSTTSSAHRYCGRGRPLQALHGLRRRRRQDVPHAAGGRTRSRPGRDIVVGVRRAPHPGRDGGAGGGAGDPAPPRRRPPQPLGARDGSAGAAPADARRLPRRRARALQPPDVEHGKRYEDIAELLDAGIDVFAAFNVQHLESLNDQVAELTGVRVRETFPDRLLAEADEVVLVDITPEALITRLREGRVYAQARVQTALDNFFRIENLQALREVALRQVAEEVEAKRLVRDPLALREERLFGSVEPKAFAERLLAFWRSSTRALSGWFAAHGARRSGCTRTSTSSWSGPRGTSRLPRAGRSSRRSGASPPCSARSSSSKRAMTSRRSPPAWPTSAGRRTSCSARPPCAEACGRVGVPLPMRLARLAPDVDVRIVADRGAPSPPER